MSCGCACVPSACLCPLWARLGCDLTGTCLSYQSDSDISGRCGRESPESLLGRNVSPVTEGTVFPGVLFLGNRLRSSRTGRSCPSCTPQGFCRPAVPRGKGEGWPGVALSPTRCSRTVRPRPSPWAQAGAQSRDLGVSGSLNTESLTWSPGSARGHAAGGLTSGPPSFWGRDPGRPAPLGPRTSLLPTGVGPSCGLRLR